MDGGGILLLLLSPGSTYKYARCCVHVGALCMGRRGVCVCTWALSFFCRFPPLVLLISLLLVIRVSAWSRAFAVLPPPPAVLHVADSRSNGPSCVYLTLPFLASPVKRARRKVGGAHHRDSRLRQHQRQAHVREAQDQELQGGGQAQEGQGRGAHKRTATVGLRFL